MAEYDRVIATATRLIKKKGQLVKWQIINDPVPPDSNKPWNQAAATPEEKDVYICFLPIDRQTFETLGYMKGNEIPKGSVMGLMANVDFEPNLKDVVLRNNKQLRIETINILSPNGQQILYTIIFK